MIKADAKNCALNASFNPDCNNLTYVGFLLS